MDIIVDTYKLNQYAQRLSSVNIRLHRLDSRLNTLYASVGWMDLWKLIQADLIVGYSWRLVRCQTYLQQTATEFENAEKLLDYDAVIRYLSHQNAVTAISDYTSRVFHDHGYLVDHAKAAVTVAKTAADSIKEACIGKAKAVTTKVSNAVSAVKKSYEEKGWAYDAVQYGKSAIKLGKAAVKLVGAVAAACTGVGIPIAICEVISAGNDIINSVTDIRYVYTDQYEMVGTTNYLKDTLVQNAGYLGEMVGNKEAGEFVGKLSYYALDVVSLLDGTSEMLKSFGKVNTIVTGSTGYSHIWGWTSFDDVVGKSDAEIVIKCAKKVKSVLKDAWDLGSNFLK